MKQTDNILKMATVLLATIVSLASIPGCVEEADKMDNSQKTHITHSAAEGTAQPDKYEKATFAAGCFWGVEAGFRAIEGVVSTQVGYAGGHTRNPTYKQVCTDKTGHAEAVQVTYDPKKVLYEQLLEAFWKMHDPTAMDRQGPDVGTQYRSAIFYHDPQQQALAKASKQRLQQTGKLDKPIVTRIAPAETFYRAEEYHQRYLEKQGKASCSSTVH